jgi:hypothetical protein
LPEGWFTLAPLESSTGVIQRIEICAGARKLGNHTDMAVEGRLHERRAALDVLVVHVCPELEQYFRDGKIAGLGGMRKCSTAVRVCGVHGSSFCQQFPQLSVIPRDSRLVDCCGRTP